MIHTFTTLQDGRSFTPRARAGGLTASRAQVGRRLPLLCCINVLCHPGCCTSQINIQKVLDCPPTIATFIPRRVEGRQKGLVARGDAAGRQPGPVAAVCGICDAGPGHAQHEPQ